MYQWGELPGNRFIFGLERTFWINLSKFSSYSGHGNSKCFAIILAPGLPIYAQKFFCLCYLIFTQRFLVAFKEREGERERERDPINIGWIETILHKGSWVALYILYFIIYIYSWAQVQIISKNIQKIKKKKVFNFRFKLNIAPLKFSPAVWIWNWPCHTIHFHCPQLLQGQGHWGGPTASPGGLSVGLVLSWWWKTSPIMLVLSSNPSLALPSLCSFPLSSCLQLRFSAH